MRQYDPRLISDCAKEKAPLLFYSNQLATPLALCFQHFRVIAKWSPVRIGSRTIIVREPIPKHPKPRGGVRSVERDPWNFGERTNDQQTTPHKREDTMADQGTGIQELMAAETRASQIVAEARIGTLL
jgi:hypothetical protein